MSVVPKDGGRRYAFPPYDRCTCNPAASRAAAVIPAQSPAATAARPTIQEPPTQTTFGNFK